MAPTFQIPVARPRFSIPVDVPRTIRLKLREPDWVRDFINALNGFDIGGASDLASRLGLQTGGLIPKGFNEDFPANLSSGELVTPVRTTKSLFNLIDGLADMIGRDQNNTRAAAEGGGDQQLTVNLQVGEKELAGVLLNLNRQGFRVA